jgi:hypothetical protein
MGKAKEPVTGSTPMKVPASEESSRKSGDLDKLYREAVVGTIRRRISLAALFTGVVAALAAQLFSSTVGISIGVSRMDSLKQAGLGGEGISMLVTLSYLIAAIVGGYVSARVAGSATRYSGAVHAIFAWCAVVLISTHMPNGALSGATGPLTPHAEALAVSTSGIGSDGAEKGVEVAAADNYILRRVVEPESGVVHIRADVSDYSENIWRSLDRRSAERLTTAIQGALLEGKVGDDFRSEAETIIAEKLDVPKEVARSMLARLMADMVDISKGVALAAEQAATKRAAAKQVAQTAEDAAGLVSFWWLVIVALGTVLAAAGGAAAAFHPNLHHGKIGHAAEAGSS